jgi:hypothetical protein
MSDSIQDALRTAKVRLDELLNVRSKIDKEILDWKKVVDSLSAVAETASDELPADVDLAADLAPILKLKFTDAIRSVLMEANGHISAPQIRDRLVQMGFDFSKYKLELGPVHNTLKRLEDQGEVASAKSDNTNTVAYRWITPVERALNESAGPHITMKRGSLGRTTKLADILKVKK